MDVCEEVYARTVLHRLRGVELVSYPNREEDASGLCAPRCHALLDAALYAAQTRGVLRLSPSHVWVTVLQGYSQLATVHADMVFSEDEEAPRDTRVIRVEDGTLAYSNPLSDWEGVFPTLYGMVGDLFPVNSFMRLVFDAGTGTDDDPVAQMAVATASMDLEWPEYTPSSPMPPVTHSSPPTPPRQSAHPAPSEDCFVRGVALQGGSSEWAHVGRLVTLLLRDTTNENASEWLTHVMTVVRMIRRTAAEFEEGDDARAAGVPYVPLSDAASDFWRRAVVLGPGEGNGPNTPPTVGGALASLYPLDRCGRVAWGAPRAFADFPRSGFRHVAFEWRSTEAEVPVQRCAVHAGLIGVRESDGIYTPEWCWSVTREEDASDSVDTVV